MTEVLGADEQRDEAVDMSRWVGLAEAVLEAEGVSGAAELSVVFVDEPSMAELNLRFRGEDGSTDVLAFPIDARELVAAAGGSASTEAGGVAGSTAPAVLGDVVICPAVARRQADEHHHRYEDEIALLVVHGILHILGMDHAEAGEAAAMQRRERELLSCLHR